MGICCDDHCNLWGNRRSFVRCKIAESDGWLSVTRHNIDSMFYYIALKNFKSKSFNQLLKSQTFDIFSISLLSRSFSTIAYL